MPAAAPCKVGSEDPDGCGVVLVWTRPLPEGGGQLGLVELLALAGAAALLTLQTAWLAF